MVFVLRDVRGRVRTRRNTETLTQPWETEPFPCRDAMKALFFRGVRFRKAEVPGARNRGETFRACFLHVRRRRFRPSRFHGIYAGRRQEPPAARRETFEKIRGRFRTEGPRAEEKGSRVGTQELSGTKKARFRPEEGTLRRHVGDFQPAQASLSSLYAFFFLSATTLRRRSSNTRFHVAPESFSWASGYPARTELISSPESSEIPTDSATALTSSTLGTNCFSDIFRKIRDIGTASDTPARSRITP